MRRLGLSLLVVCLPLAAGNTYGRLPLTFEPNRGQTEARVKFLARASGYTLFVTADEAVFAGRDGSAERMKLLGANPKPRFEPLDKQPGISNYFIGNDPSEWHTNIPNYGRVAMRGVYPGIDLIFYGNERQLEYDWVVAPGADPKRIHVQWEGPSQVTKNATGDLVLSASLVQHKPIILQEGKRIDGGYVVRGREVAFELAKYDATKPLVIDPLLEFSAVLGGSSPNSSGGIAVDSSGNVYVTGSTVASNFPTTPGAFLTTCAGCPNFPVAFVAKLNATASALLYSTFIGGRVSTSNPVHGSALAVDLAGNAYITGDTFTADFPTTPGAFRNTISSPSAAYAVKLGPSGGLVYSTFVGPANTGSGIAVDSTGNAYVTGLTSASDFPTTPGSFQPARAGTMPSSNAFVAKLNPSGSGLVYATYLGGSTLDSPAAIAVDATGSAYVTGFTDSTDFPTTQGAFQTNYGGSGNCCFGVGDAFVTKLDPTGSALVYSTFLGGNQGDVGSGIAVTPDGNAYVTGYTFSADFPTTAGGLRPHLQQTVDGYIARLDSSGSKLVYSTYLGGATTVAPTRVAVDSSGAALIVGQTLSSSFPIASPLQPTVGFAAGAFLEKLNAPGSAVIFSTLLGGSFTNAVAVDAAGNAYVAGESVTGSLPVTPGAFQSSPVFHPVFVTKISNIRLPVVSLSSTAVSFPNQLVGGASTTLNVSLTNDGDATLNIPGIASNGDFRQVSTCGVAVPAGSTCGIDITFVPVTGGARSGKLSITDSAFGSPHLVSLSGTGINPVPVLASLAPSAVTAGGAAFTLTVTGSNFVPADPGSAASGSVVRWNGSDRPTTFVSSGRLSAAIAGTDIGAPGIAQVSVFNPAPGGGTSSVASLSIATPVQISTATHFVPVTPCRIADTRNPNGPFGGPAIAGNTSRDFAIPNSVCGVPSTAAAYSMNVAVVPSGPLGFLTLWPSGQSQPLVATLNSDGRIKSNAAIVPAGANGAISVFATDATDVILDINGYFVSGNSPAALAFYPLTPCRIADTRNPTAPLGGPSLAALSTRSFPIQASSCGLPATAQAYSLNFAAVPKGPSLGFMTAWPDGQTRPLVASLNDPTGTVLANAVVVPAGTGGAVNVYTTDNTDLVIDINGYFAPQGTGGLSLYTVTPCRVLDSRLPAGSPPFSTTRDVNVTASQCGVPATAQAFVFNATVVPPTFLGYITMWPQGQTQPLAATLNAYDGAVTNNMAIVPTTTGSISVFPSAPTHLVLDIFGYFAP